MASGGAPVKYNVRYCQLQKWPNVPSIGFSLEKAPKPPHLIGTVESNSPASTAGLRIGDAVIEVNDKDFSSADYTKLQKTVGDAIRDKGKINLLVVEKEKYEAAKKEKLLKKKTALMLTTPATIPDHIANFPKNTPRTCNIRLGSEDRTFGFDLVQGTGNVGAFIQDITPNTPASRTPLRKSDRIIEINDEFVDDLLYQDIRSRLAQAKTAGALKLYVMDTATYKHYKTENLPLASGSADGRGQDADDQDGDSDDGGDPPDRRPPSYQYTRIDTGRDDDDDDDDDIDDDGPRSRVPSNPRGEISVGSGLAGLAAGPRMDIRECTITRADPTQPLGFSLSFNPPDYPTFIVSREGGQLKNPTTAGLIDGDAVIEINGKPTRGVPENEVKQRIRETTYPQPMVLLVADQATVRHYDSIRQPITNRLPNVRRLPERTESAVVARPAKPGRDAASIVQLTDNPLTGTRQSSPDVYANQVETPRGSTRVPAVQRTCLLRSSPGSPGMGFSLNNQEPDGTPHRVTIVSDNTPASRAGLKVGDILISINDTNVERMNRTQTVQTLKDAITQEKSSGTPVKLVVREDVPSRAPSVVSSRPASRRPTHTDGGDNISITSASLAANQRLYVLRSSPDFAGLGFGLNLNDLEGTPYRITLVKPGSPAERENLRAGDTLISINGQNIENLPRAQVKELLNEAIEREKKQRTPVKLVVQHDTPAPPGRISPVSSLESARSRSGSTVVPPRAQSPVLPAVQPEPGQRPVRLKPNKIGGIGIDLDPQQASGNPARITRVTPLSPAAGQGIRVGDKIVAINGKSVKGMSNELIRLELAGAMQREKEGGPAVELIIEPASDDSDSDDETFEPSTTTQTTSHPQPPTTAQPMSTYHPPSSTAVAPVTNDRNGYRLPSNSRGKDDRQKEDNPYAAVNDVINMSQASTRSIRRDRTQVEVISVDRMYRVYHLNVKPGQSLGFGFETEGNRHLVRRLERGCDAERKGLAENDQIVEVNDENVLDKPNRSVYHALQQASMKGYLVLVVFPRSVRALTKRSEQSLSSINLRNGGRSTTLSSSMGDLSSSAAAMRSRRDWNFEESPFRQLPDPLSDPTDPLPRSCVLDKDSSSSNCGFRLAEQDGYDTPIVVEITPNGPARRSGLVVGDHIVYIDQQNVQLLRTFREKTQLIQERFTTNNRVTLVALTAAAYRVLHKRGGVLKPEKFDYQAIKQNPLRPRLSELSRFDYEDDFGFSVYPNSPTYIREVRSGSAAAEDGLTKNDKILELNGDDISALTAREIEKIIRDSRINGHITLLTIDPEGYEYAVRHAIPLHSDLPLVERPRGQRAHRREQYSNSVAL